MFTAFLLTHLIQPVSASESSDAFAEYTLPLDIALLGLGVLGYLGTHQIPITIDPPRSTPVASMLGMNHNGILSGKPPVISDAPCANYGFNLPVLTLTSVGAWGWQTQSSASSVVSVTSCSSHCGFHRNGQATRRTPETLYL